ncbi:hypothetical protein [Mucilaginibacter gynuensis]
MKYFVLVLFCSISFSASAQWWRIGPLKGKRFPPIANTTNHSVEKIKFEAVSCPKIISNELISWYRLNMAEYKTMRNAQHNMRFREYSTASYNFSDLANIYIKQNRLSEAKWYLLQSILISRRENNSRHTLANLISLANVKIDMGDVNLGRQDLLEARQIASSNGWKADEKVIVKKLESIQGINSQAPKSELKYADNVDPVAKSK